MRVLLDENLTMTVDKVHWFLNLFDELGIQVWIDGGWGVDALLGAQTRNHQDLDIIIPWEDSAVLTEALFAHGFVDIHTDDRTDRNFVMGHQTHGMIDFHVVERTEDGGAVYGPGEIDWIISELELDAVGYIGGREVRCLSVDYQVRSHAGYPLQDTDFADMQALHDKFSVELLPEQIKNNSNPHLPNVPSKACQP
ncbi:amino acid transporter [Candidatus Poribacteria bacterium]|nr:amino acid transporter [Candidatus Poribacteria bacterium]MYK20067.1 amino acid transporter [Candidatus Poribacteria bacterium]